MTDDLERFTRAQDDRGTFAQALAELRRGRKASHWMWFVFPQVAGLGQSPTARYFAIADLDEARAFLAHPVLGPRLEEAFQAAIAAPVADADALLGGIDALKLRSSATLFLRAGSPTGQAVLDRFFAGDTDDATDVLVRGE